jgi:hypothetical protein
MIAKLLIAVIVVSCLATFVLYTIDEARLFLYCLSWVMSIWNAAATLVAIAAATCATDVANRAIAAATCATDAANRAIAAATCATDAANRAIAAATDAAARPQRRRR